MAISFDSAFAGHDKFLKFRSDRAAVLANNIANADTPNFKARDISFFISYVSSFRVML